MKYGLIGEHLGHSFSKQIQTRIAEIENVKDYDYQLVELNKEEFKEFMEKKDFKGINVTIPYKKDVIPYLDEMDESAESYWCCQYNDQCRWQIKRVQYRLWWILIYG